MAKVKNVKGARNSVSAARSSAAIKKPKPWGTIAAVVAVVLFAGGVFGYTYVKFSDKKTKEDAAKMWQPSADNHDPSDKINGVVKKDYQQGKHVQATQRVAYDQSPPFGGPHDNAWATCDVGVVYDKPVRNENMVHALEHGTVWIAYNPDKVSGGELDKLKDKVTGQPYMMLSPYPNLDKPISVQSWGHQLKVDSAGDDRIDHFIAALRQNIYTTPEKNARCDSLAQQGGFDPDNPAPFDDKAPGADAVPMTGGEDAGKDDSKMKPTGAAQPPATGGTPTGQPAPAQTGTTPTPSK